MRAAYESFRTGSPPDGILAAAAPAMQTGGHDAFYSQLVSRGWVRGIGKGSLGGDSAQGGDFLFWGGDLPRKAQDI